MPQTYDDEAFAAFLVHQMEALNTLSLESENAKTVKAKLTLLLVAMIVMLRSTGNKTEQTKTSLEEISVRLPRNAYDALVRRSMDHEPQMELPLLVAHILGSDLVRTGHFIPEGMLNEALLDRGQEIGVLIPTGTLAALDVERRGRSRQEMIREVLRKWASNLDVVED